MADDARQQTPAEEGLPRRRFVNGFLGISLTALAGAPFIGLYLGYKICKRDPTKVLFREEFEEIVDKLDHGERLSIRERAKIVGPGDDQTPNTVILHGEDVIRE